VNRFRLSPEARQDVKEIWSYTARDSVENLIIYRPDTRPLEILRVLHGKRDVKSVEG